MYLIIIIIFEMSIAGRSDCRLDDCYAIKPINKSLQNIQSECAEEKLSSTKGEDEKQPGHRRSASQSLSPTYPKYQRFNSYQPSTNDSSKSGENTAGLRPCKSEDYLVNRLLIVSSKIRNVVSIRHALVPGVYCIQYNYDSSTLDDIETMIAQTINGKKVQSIAFIIHCTGSSLFLSAKEDKNINKDGSLDKSVQEFFLHIVQNHFSHVNASSRIDFLGWHCLQNTDTVPPFVLELQNLTGVTVGVWRDLSGVNVNQKLGEDGGKCSIGELYFRLDKLRNWSGRHQQSLAGFEKIRTVGKGAYGAAVLYKKKDDESLVVLKEINMHDLNASERQLALNEVSVLAMLDHPNIISYYDSFEEDGVLMIEMEYADNGTLAQFLAKQQDRLLEEKCILAMFQQLVAAIMYIHSHNILHRDLKTDNIFLTKEGVIKIGDFGISKMMGSASIVAQTVLGTPYYISPEMCEGKQYSFKSDIWALGCVLYEMACLQKTFEGSNLPAVVNKIMKGSFPPLKGNFSDEFKDMVTDMLKKNPDERPEAQDIMYTILPQLLNKQGSLKSDQDEASSDSKQHKGKIRSVLYYFESSSGILTCVNDLPPRMKIKHMAVGPDHVIVTTTERQVFSWGCGGSGQLGHGDTKNRDMPTPVEGLKGKSITICCCGLGFSVFGSDNGLVLTCGDGSNGCLGHGDWCNETRPRLIESLLSVDVMAIASGLKHVVAIGRSGQVLSWGDGSSGQLGLGSEESQCIPTEVHIAEAVVFKDVNCGVDGTMLISDVGGVFACGNNENNKLGLNNRQGFLMAMKNIFNKTEVDGKNVPTPVRSLARHRVVVVSMGANHTAVIVEPGHVITFGKNSEGQLGNLNSKPSAAPVEVKTLEQKAVNRVQCGEHYTVAGTKDHELYYWGLRYKMPPPVRSEDTTSQSSCNESSTGVQANLHKDDMCVESLATQLNSSNGSQFDEKEEFIKKHGIANEPQDQVSNTHESDSQGFRPISSIPRRSLSASSQERSKDKEISKDGSILILHPMELIKLKQGNEKMLLGNIYCHGENLFIQVETTAPPPRRRTFKKRIFRRKSGQSLSATSSNSINNRGGKTDDNSCSSETSEMDTHSDIPAWLKEELAQSAAIGNDGNEADDTSAQSDEERRTEGIDSSMSSIQVNRVISPVANNICLSSRLDPVFISGDKLSPRQNYRPQTRNRVSSVNSSGSNTDALFAETFTDSSSGEVGKSLKKHSTSSALPPRVTLNSKTKSKLQTKTKDRVTVKDKTPPLVPRDRGVVRGLVSDVTAKRREESLLFELERVKQEKKQADARVRLLEKEREMQKEYLKQEAEKIAKEREVSLVNEVEKLRLEIEAQNNVLQNHQRVVYELQHQLNLVMVEQQSLGNGLTPRSNDEEDLTPRYDGSTQSSKGKISKICLLQ
ncbi:uncharacterized protein LOC131935999 [Physella acuta]|uniref:uncharacterized protein LOC131935999 n=1 Tax=Physella acuta TaxID=109671 RepID=UPI0027DD3607|nr:uncharacterized protein LOC131935999 [Physella acuta]XP_059148770.1 uncharacterized protein LOC131935999 [Physella acuta]